MKTLLFVQFIIVWGLTHALTLFLSLLSEGDWGWAVSLTAAAFVFAALLRVNNPRPGR